MLAGEEGQFAIGTPFDILQNLCLIDKNSPFYDGGDNVSDALRPAEENDVAAE